MNRRFVREGTPLTWEGGSPPEPVSADCRSQDGTSPTGKPSPTQKFLLQRVSTPAGGRPRHPAHIAEYEREDYQARALLEMRILANSVSGQAAEPAATVAGRIGGHDTPTGGGQRAGRVRLGGDLSANGGSGRLRDVNDNRHSRGDGWAAGQPVGAVEEAGLAVSSRAGRSEGGVDGADRAGAVAHRGGDAFHRPGPDVADCED